MNQCNDVKILKRASLVFRSDTGNIYFGNLCLIQMLYSIRDETREKINPGEDDVNALESNQIISLINIAAKSFLI